MTPVRVSFYQVAPKGCGCPKGSVAHIVACSKSVRSAGLGLSFVVRERYCTNTFRSVGADYETRKKVVAVVRVVAKKFGLPIWRNNYWGVRQSKNYLHVSRGPVTKEQLARGRKARDYAVELLLKRGLTVILTDERGGTEVLPNEEVAA